MVTELHVTLHCFVLYVSESTLGGLQCDFSSTHSACLYEVQREAAAYSIRPYIRKTHYGLDDIQKNLNVEIISDSLINIPVVSLTVSPYCCLCLHQFSQSLCFLQNTITHSQVNDSQECFRYQAECSLLVEIIISLQKNCDIMESLAPVPV